LSFLKSKWKILLICFAGAILYGCFNFISGRIHPPGCTFVELRPQVMLPMFIGIVYGPLAGFVVGCLGDSLGYGLQGLSLFHAWNWSVGNGFIGMIPGLARVWGIEKVRTGRDFQLILLLIFLASSLPIVFAASLDTLLSHISFIDSTYTLILPAFITDAIFGLLLVPAMLLLFRKMIVTIEMRIMLMTTYPLILAVLLTYMASNWSTLRESMSDTTLIRDFYNLGILSLCVLITGLIASTFLTRKITRPVVSLTDAAVSIANGDYHPSADLEETAARDDEMGQLAGVFEQMRHQVYSREQRLKQEVSELKIEIDKSKQSAEVKKITGTDYFKNLREKASKLRIEE
jgi:energy-coupling factor transport system substrate-specific component